MESASLASSCLAALCISRKTQSTPRMGSISRSSTKTTGASFLLALEFNTPFDKVVRRPGPVVIEGEVVVELLCGFKHPSLKLRRRRLLNETSQVHHLALVAALIPDDLGAMRGENIFNIA